MTTVIDEGLEEVKYPRLMKVKVGKSGAGSIWLFSDAETAMCLYGINDDETGEYQDELNIDCFENCNNSVTLRN